MQHNIDTFIRHLQSSIAKRKIGLRVLGGAIQSTMGEYSNIKVEYFREMEQWGDVPTDLSDEYYKYKELLNTLRTTLANNVKKQKAERKMLAYFINERRYTKWKIDNGI